MTTSRNKRSYMVASAILLIFVGATLDFVGIMVAQPLLAVFGGILTIIGAILIVCWFVNYLHELDGRLEHVEDWLEESTHGKQ